MELSKEELKEINGGGILKYKFLIFGGIISFIAGIIDGYTRPLKCNQEEIMELTKEELKEINGGSIPGALVTSIIRGIGQIYEIGRGIGSAIRRFVTKRFC